MLTALEDSLLTAEKEHRKDCINQIHPELCYYPTSDFISIFQKEFQMYDELGRQLHRMMLFDGVGKSKVKGKSLMWDKVQEISRISLQYKQVIECINNNSVLTNPCGYEDDEIILCVKIDSFYKNLDQMRWKDTYFDHMIKC